jgi:hypothetical protein
MGIKQKCYELAKKLGATITDNGEWVGVEAPAGYLSWDDIHEAIIQYNPVIKHLNRNQFWAEVYSDLKTMQKDGFAKCQTLDCEWCEDK